MAWYHIYTFFNLKLVDQCLFYGIIYAQDLSISFYFTETDFYVVVLSTSIYIYMYIYTAEISKKQAIVVHLWQ